jgi:hypothetical protein
MEPQRKKGKTIHSKAREIIRRVILACDEESRQGKLTHRVTDSSLYWNSGQDNYKNSKGRC